MKSSPISVLFLLSLLSAQCSASVWTTVYDANGIVPVPLLDPNTPNIYADVMVGTHLTIIVNSDTETVLWTGRLDIGAADAGRAALWPCDYDELTYDRQASCSVLPAAQSLSGIGCPPRVERIDATMGGHFITLAGTEDPGVGQWFAIDYHATGLGECRVRLFEDVKLPLPPQTEGPVPTVLEPLQESVFNHVPTRDFDDNHGVDFIDFALMASHFQHSADRDPTDFASEYDFDQNQCIDATDIAMFMDFWLAKTR